jgi:hypothetical protein
MAVLGQTPLERERAQRLPDLARTGALMLALQQARHLHGQRRAARHDALVRCRACQTARPTAQASMP